MWRIGGQESSRNKVAGAWMVMGEEEGLVTWLDSQVFLGQMYDIRAFRCGESLSVLWWARMSTS